MTEAKDPRFEQGVRDSFKANLLAPTRGNELIARGRVIRAGRTVTVCHADAFMQSATGESLVATMLATMMTILGRPDVSG